MGQYWKPLNIDKRQSDGSWGKLGEFFFGSSPHWFVARLSPVPKIPDCDTFLSPFEPGKVLEGFYHYPDMHLPQTAPQSSDTTALVKLPVETIQEIYEHLEDSADVICLSMTCQFLWDIGRRQVYRRLVAFVTRFNNSWAGDRIVCVGDYLYTEDIPEGLLTAEETIEFTETFEDGDTLYSYPFSAAPKGHSVITLVRDFFTECRMWDRLGRGHPDLRTFQDLHHTNCPLPSSRDLYVLRNLSRLQYVRESVLLDLVERTKGTIRYMENIGLGHVVLSRICLSSDSSVSMGYKGGIHRGVWAGDRFDIVTEEWLIDSDVDGDVTWTDVSTEVVEETEKIVRGG